MDPPHGNPPARAIGKSVSGLKGGGPRSGGENIELGVISSTVAFSMSVASRAISSLSGNNDKLYPEEELSWAAIPDLLPLDPRSLPVLGPARTSPTPWPPGTAPADPKLWKVQEKQNYY